MSEGVLRKLATLTSVRRSRGYDERRQLRNGDPGREERVRSELEKVSAAVEELRKELVV